MTIHNNQSNTFNEYKRQKSCLILKIGIQSSKNFEKVSFRLFYIEFEKKCVNTFMCTPVDGQVL